MYNFGCLPSNSAAFLVSVGQDPHLVGPRFCVLVFLVIVLEGAIGVLLVGLAAMQPAVAAVLLGSGVVSRHRQGKLLLHGGKKGANFT